MKKLLITTTVTVLAFGAVFIPTPVRGEVNEFTLEKDSCGDMQVEIDGGCGAYIYEEIDDLPGGYGFHKPTVIDGTSYEIIYDEETDTSTLRSHTFDGVKDEILLDDRYQTAWNGGDQLFTKIDDSEGIRIFRVDRFDGITEFVGKFNFTDYETLKNEYHYSLEAGVDGFIWVSKTLKFTRSSEVEIWTMSPTGEVIQIDLIDYEDRGWLPFTDSGSRLFPYLRRSGENAVVGIKEINPASGELTQFGEEYSFTSDANSMYFNQYDDKDGLIYTSYKSDVVKSPIF